LLERYVSEFLQELGMLHGTVNDSENYVNPETDVHTNGIEGN
jgi:hypothetical protein